MTCIGGNFSALCMKSAKAGQNILMHDLEFRICDSICDLCGYMSDQLITGLCSSDRVFLSIFI